MAQTSVSRETVERLSLHLELLERWQSKINLVGASTLRDPWRRHVLDSWQLFRFVTEPDRPLADLGSGAGFPGLVLAISGCRDVHLVESDRRKAAFLREAARLTEAPVTVHAARIESLAALGGRFATVTARALAELPRLLNLAVPLLAAGGECLFPKGAAAAAELTAARRAWDIEVREETSLADPAARILRLRPAGPIHA